MNIRIHPLWFVSGIYFYVYDFLEWWLMIQLIVLLHEFGHAWMAKSLHWKIITLHMTPIGGMLELEPRWISRTTDLVLVALSGPAMNALLIIVGNLIGDFQAWSGANLMMILFNLLPIFPLDGGQIVKAILYRWIEYDKAERILVIWGLLVTFLGVGLFIQFVGYHFGIIIIGLFLVEQNIHYLKMLKWRSLRRRFMSYSP